MIHKQKGLITILFAILLFLILFPAQSFAVEYSIPNVKIDASLHENGNVNVVETHQYRFEGEFNGITREIIPKQGTSITEFHATENGKELRVEKEGHLYRIYRKGSDETITVELTYSIQIGVDVYNDVAEFYWPFFDDRNESTYENLTVTIHPPKNTDDVIAFGYDLAFNKENVNENGSVTFNFGEVPYEMNGDIRIAYDSSLFPTAPIAADIDMREKIMNAKQELLDQAIADQAIKDKLASFAKITMPLLTFLMLILIVGTYMQTKLKKMAIEREINNGPLIPPQTLSLPATIVYTNGSYLVGNDMAAALMDLVRKGIIAKMENNHFKVMKTNQKLLKHEEILIDFLFYRVGSNGEFHFDDLSLYTKNKKNHGKYREYQSQWMSAIHEEINMGELKEKKMKLRWGIGLTCLPLLAFSILFLIYELYLWCFIAFILSITVIIFSIAYNPKTWKGLKLTLEWRNVKEHLHQFHSEKWKTLSEDEKMRAYIYGIGIKDKNMTEYSKEIINTFNPPTLATSYQGQYVDMTTIAYMGPIATTSFYAANKETVSTTTSTDSSSSFDGGGVGGGGGGSGAF